MYTNDYSLLIHDVTIHKLDDENLHNILSIQSVKKTCLVVKKKSHNFFFSSFDDEIWRAKFQLYGFIIQLFKSTLPQLIYNFF